MGGRLTEFSSQKRGQPQKGLCQYKARLSGVNCIITHNATPVRSVFPQFAGKLKMPIVSIYNEAKLPLYTKSCCYINFLAARAGINCAQLTRLLLQVADFDAKLISLIIKEQLKLHLM